MLGKAVRALVVVVGVVGLVVIPLFYTRILGVDDPPNRPVIAVDNLWLLLLFLGLLLGVLWLARDRVLRGAALGVTLVVILVLDLFSATMPFNPVDQDLVASYREPEVTAFLQERWSDDEPFRVDIQHPGLYPNFGAVDGLHNASGVFDPMQPAAYTALHNALAEGVSSPGYDMLNVRYRIQPPDNEVPEGFEQVFASSTGTRVLEHESALPRAWFVSDVQEMDRAAALDAVRAGSFDPSETAIIQSPPVQPNADASGSVSLTEYQPERITLNVDVDGAGYLLVSDGYYPGWTASVDGEPAGIHEANHGLRAVPVRAGAERVELRFEPPLVTAGLGIGLIGVVLLLVLAGLGLWQRDGRGDARTGRLE